MNDPRDPSCCSDQGPCCAAPDPPAKKKPWKTLLFILVLSAGAALAVHSLMADKDASCAAGCSEPCGE
jgi:hypothetical protein